MAVVVRRELELSSNWFPWIMAVVVRRELELSSNQSTWIAVERLRIGIQRGDGSKLDLPSSNAIGIPGVVVVNTEEFDLARLAIHGALFNAAGLLI